MTQKMGMKTKMIIIDTNALMAVGEQKMDIFRELERICLFPFTLAVLSGTVDELKKIQQEQRGKYKTAANIALKLLSLKKVQVISSEEMSSKESFKPCVDEELIKQSKKGNLILTQDKELKKRLTKPFLTIRQKKKIVLVE